MNDLSRKEQARLEKVRSRGLEPPCLSTLVPETSASAISPRAHELITLLSRRNMLRQACGRGQGKEDSCDLAEKISSKSSLEFCRCSRLIPTPRRGMRRFTA